MRSPRAASPSTANADESIAIVPTVIIVVVVARSWRMSASAHLSSSLRPGTALVHEGHRPGPAHVAGVEPLKFKTGAFDKRSDRAVQVTTTGKGLPPWSKAVLPPAHVRLRGEAVLDEEKPAA